MSKSWIAIVAGVLVLLSPAPSQPGETESGSFRSWKLGNTWNPCGDSTFVESCPSQSSTSGCTCFNAEGSISGEPFGKGYAEVDLNIDGRPLASGCSMYNGSLFIIGAQDLQEIDFSGSFCLSSENSGRFSGNYGITVSTSGYAGTGEISGQYGQNMTLHFSGPVSR